MDYSFEIANADLTWNDPNVSPPANPNTTEFTLFLTSPITMRFMHTLCQMVVGMQELLTVLLDVYLVTGHKTMQP